MKVSKQEPSEKLARFHLGHRKTEEITYIPLTALTIAVLISSCKAGLRKTHSGNRDILPSTYLRISSSVARTSNAILP
jgi:hypothetical protein